MCLGNASGQVGLANYQQMAGGSAQAEKILDQAGIQDPSGEVVLVQNRGPVGASPSPSFRRAVDATVAAVGSTGLAYDIENPCTDHLFSANGRAALVGFNVKPGDNAKIGAVLAAVARAQAANPRFSLRETGDASGTQALNNLLGSNFAREEWTAVPLALGILLVAFGALVAALLPVMLALSAFMAALGLADLLSHAVGLDSYANSVMLLMGLAVGVDYSLFYLRRERQERRAGRSNRDALAVAAATSGRSVLVSGLVVMTGMAGMLVSGMGTFVGLGLAAMLVVLVAMLASVTVLPSVLSWLGDRVERGRVRVRPLRAHQQTSAGAHTREGLTGRLVGRVLARPGLSAVGAGVLVLVLAAPALGMHAESLDLAQLLPYSSPQAVTARQVAAEFPGTPSPAAVVIKAPRISARDMRAQLAYLEREGQASGDLRPPVQLLVYARANVEILVAPLAGDGLGATSQHALQSLRDDLVPRTVGQVPGAQAYVSGDLAESLDYNAALHRAAIEAFAFVLATAFVIMLLALRSLAIAAVTLVLDALSVAVAYGIMTAVFQHGWGASLVGTHAVGAIESWIPLFLFARAVRAVHGLPRVRRLAHPGGPRPGPAYARGSQPGLARQRRRGDQRGSHHGGRVRGVRHAVDAGLQAAGSGPGSQRPAGRHRRPAGATALAHHHDGREGLVPAPVGTDAGSRPGPGRKPGDRASPSVAVPTSFVPVLEPGGRRHDRRA